MYRQQNGLCCSFLSRNMSDYHSKLDKIFSTLEIFSRKVFLIHRVRILRHISSLNTMSKLRFFSQLVRNWWNVGRTSVPAYLIPYKNFIVGHFFVIRCATLRDVRRRVEALKNRSTAKVVTVGGSQVVIFFFFSKIIFISFFTRWSSAR